MKARACDGAAHPQRRIHIVAGVRIDRAPGKGRR
jgi:hypothetical protein